MEAQGMFSLEDLPSWAQDGSWEIWKDLHPLLILSLFLIILLLPCKDVLPEIKMLWML
jgi:hypothetical protein